MYILGIGGLVHDASVALMKDGVIVAAVEEERFARVKHAGYQLTRLPYHSIEYCLQQVGITADDVDYVGYYFLPWKEFRQSCLFRLRRSWRVPKMAAYYAINAADILRQHLRAEQFFSRMRTKPLDFTFLPHHLCHAASAFFVSPFDQAAILTLDAIGESASTVLWFGQGNQIKRLEAVRFPHSWGTFYALMTQYLGFRPYNDEYKVMGLASYSAPTYYRQMADVIHIRADGLYEINLDYFTNGFTGPTYFNDRFYRTFGPPRRKDEEIQDRHIEIAASLQKLLEDSAMALAERLRNKTGARYLCIAGGVGLNSVMNGKLLASGLFEDVYVQPSANDAGCSLGAALYVAHAMHNMPRNFVMDHAYFGPEYDDAAIQKALREAKVPVVRLEDPSRKAAELMAEGKIVAWYQGRLEWGPRALGNRSILADPTREDMKDIVNRWVKHREDFRPFAPSVLEERAQEYFEGITTSPFMIFVVPVKPEKRSVIPAVTHVDGTARPQTVNRATNPRYYDLWRIQLQPARDGHCNGRVVPRSRHL